MGIVTVIYMLMTVALCLMVPREAIDENATFAMAFDYVGMHWAKHVVAVGALLGEWSLTFYTHFRFHYGKRIMYQHAASNAVIATAARASALLAQPQQLAHKLCIVAPVPLVKCRSGADWGWVNRTKQGHQSNIAPHTFSFSCTRRYRDIHSDRRLCICTYPCGLLP